MAPEDNEQWSIARVPHSIKGLFMPLITYFPKLELFVGGGLFPHSLDAI